MSFKSKFFPTIFDANFNALKSGFLFIGVGTNNKKFLSLRSL